MPIYKIDCDVKGCKERAERLQSELDYDSLKKGEELRQFGIRLDASYIVSLCDMVIERSKRIAELECKLVIVEEKAWKYDELAK